MLTVSSAKNTAIGAMSDFEGTSAAVDTTALHAFEGRCSAAVAESLTGGEGPLQMAA